MLPGVVSGAAGASPPSGYDTNELSGYATSTRSPPSPLLSLPRPPLRGTGECLIGLREGSRGCHPADHPSGLI